MKSIRFPITILEDTFIMIILVYIRGHIKYHLPKVVNYSGVPIHGQYKVLQWNMKYVTHLLWLHCIILQHTISICIWPSLYLYLYSRGYNKDTYKFRNGLSWFTSAWTIIINFRNKNNMAILLWLYWKILQLYRK